MSSILEKLKGGDLRSIGKADEVVIDVLKNPSLFKDVFEGMLNDDPLIRMRSADVIEKVSQKYPEYLQPFKYRLINEVYKLKQKEVRWHVAQMFSYIEISKKERDQIMGILFTYINDEKSKIVKTFSMQTLANFAERDASIKPRILEFIEEIMKTGSPAVKSRGKKLIKALKK
ncbi:MAG: hypothetical protein ACXAEX_13180 [Promethearchaeota archaeon]|jgi:Mg2+ and Co2+ transporter CorA